MIAFKRAAQDATQDRTPSSWDRVRYSEELRAHKLFEHDIAMATCPNGHMCRISDEVHQIAADGTLTPSYVCPVDGCGFHDFVKFEGW